MTLRQYIDQRFTDLFRAQDIQRRADVEALVDARNALNARLDGMNEFRQALTDQASQFVRREEAEAQWTRTTERLNTMAAEHVGFVGRSEHDALADRITSLDTRMTRAEGTDTGAASRQASLRQTVIVAVAVLGLVLTAIVALLDHFVSR